MPSNPLDDEITVVAYFPDSAGLFVGNDVGILGVPVGKITDIEPAGIEVKVTMRVDADRAIPADAGAAVVARSVATDRYVELTPVYSSGPKLEDGAEIAREKTATPVDFDDVLEALNTFATGISGSKDGTKAIQRIIEDGEAAFRGKGELFNDTITSLADAVNGVAGNREDLSATLTSLDALVDEIAQNEGTARTFVQQVSRASKMLAEERENFRSALRSLDDAVTVVADFAVTNRAQVVKALGGTSKVFRTMLRKQKQLTEILEVLPLSLQNLDMVVTPEGRAPVRGAPVGDPSLRRADRRAVRRAPRPDLRPHLRLRPGQHLADGRCAMNARLRVLGRVSLPPACCAPPRTHAGGVAGRSKDEASLPSRRRLAIARPGRRSRRPRIGRHALGAALAAVLVSGCSTTLSDVPIPGKGVSGDTITVKADFEEALNLAQGATVKVNGVDSGKVQEVVAKDFQAQAEMLVKEDAGLREGATARLRYTTPLGELFVDVTNPPTGEPLKDGAVLTTHDTSTAPTVEDALSQASLLVNGGGLAQLQTVTEELNAIIGGREDTVRSLLDGSASFLTEANATTGRHRPGAALRWPRSRARCEIASR